jgi:putative NADPH-quinone reductase
MKVLCITAHPNRDGSFTSQLVDSFISGLDHRVQTSSKNVFFDSFDEIKDEVEDSDHICIAFPLWWEMPPAKLVDFLQQTFVLGFAFDYVDGVRTLLIKKKVTCLISMGQKKDYNVSNLQQAMEYCGMSAQFIVFQGIGPGLSEEMISLYKDLARRQGFSILKD